MMKNATKLRAAAFAVGISLHMAAVPATAAEKVEVPEEVLAISEELGQKYNICPELIQAITWRESRFQADADGGSCVGIMQINKRWHLKRMDRLGVTDLWDMRQNMLVGVDLLAELFERHGEASVVLAAYHGEADVYKVSKYTEGILAMSAELEREHGK